MSSKNKLQLPFWIARVWSLLALLFLIVFLGAHVVESINAGKPIFSDFSAHELFSFLFFPLGMIISLIIVQFRYRLGGYLCIICMIGFLIMQPELVMSPMIYFFGFPGVLFLIYSYLKPDYEVSYH